MPITIGPFDNVPAPGDPIRSNWPQEISQWVIDNAAQGVIGYNLDIGTPASSQKLLIQARQYVYTADSNGDFQISFGTPFAAGNVNVQVSNGDYANRRIYHVGAPNTTNVWINATLFDGQPARNLACNLIWLAVGRRP